MGPDHVTPAELAAQFAADREGDAYLLLRDDRGAQRIVSLGGRDALTIGRLPGNDLVVDWHPSVSRTHAILELRGTQWTLVDDGLSSNGSHVNGERVHGRRRLADQDELRLGDLRITFREPGVEVVETAAVSEGGEVVLTPAQRRVLVALCRPIIAEHGAGAPASNREIAEALHLSVESVRTHMRALFDAFAVPDLLQNRKRAELARAAMRAGMVTRHDVGL